jgi:chaperonin GroEL
MSDSWQASVVLITSSDPSESHFGTGFVIDKDEQTTCLLTCTHVVRDVGGPEKIEIAGTQARVIASNPEEGADLAVLCVERPLEIPPLPLYATSEKGKRFSTAGFQLDGKRFVIRELQGKLGEQVGVQMRGQADRLWAWDLEITDEYLLQPGYSGSPVVDEYGNVIGVVNTRRGEGKTGVAISIEALRKVWPEMPRDLFAQNRVGGIGKAVKEPISRSQIEVSSTQESLPPIQESEETSHTKKRMALVAKNIQQQILKDAKVGENVDTILTLAQALVNEGVKQVSVGVNPLQMTFGIEMGTEAVISYIRRMAVTVETEQQVMQVASHSVADETIGNLITEVLDHVGRDGVITVESSRGTNFETEYSEGMLIDQGPIFSDFVTNAEKLDAVFDNPYILISDKKISLAQDILPLLAQMELEHLSNLVIIAEDVDGEALAILIEKKRRSLLNVVIVTAPDSGEYRREILRDIAILTGGRVISQSLNKVTLADLGQAFRIVAHKNEITIVEGRGEAEDIQARIRQIMGQRGEAANDYDRERLQMRLAQLSGGLARIKVGASTDTERMSRKTSVERAIAVAHAAIEGGLVPGDGVVLLNAVEALDQMHMQRDVATGVSVLRRALEEPLRQLALHGGRDGSKIIEGIRDAQRIHQNKSYGYNMLTGTYENLLEFGIVDAAEILCSELRKASHIAITILRG